MIWLVSIIAFIYIISRLNQIDYKLKLLDKGRSLIPPVFPDEPKHEAPQPAEHHPVHAVHTPPVEQPVRDSIGMLNQPVSDIFSGDKNWEMKLGGQFFTVIGSIAVLFGIAFFLKYAFDHDIISESGRVALGFIGGIIAIVLGQFTKKKYPLYGQILMGLGLAVFYLTIFAGFNYYHLFSQTTAFISMMLVTGIGIVLGINENSEALTGFAQFGGFVTPFLLANGQNNPGVLFTYILLLNAGIIVLNFYKPWQSLNLGALIGTILVYLSWLSDYYNPGQFNVAFSFATLFFLLFFAASLIQYLVQKTRTDEKALALLSFNTIFYYSVSYYLINPLYPDWMGPFTFLLAAAFLAVSFATYKPEKTDDYYHNFLMGWSFILLFIGIPIQFKKFVVSIGWAAEALVMIILGFKLRARYLRYLAHCIFIFATFYIFVYIPQHPPATLWINTRTMSAVMIAACMVAAAYIYWMKKQQAEKLPNHERNEFSEAISALVSEAYIIIIWMISIEITDAHQGVWLSIAWSVLALGIGLAGLKIKNLVLRILAYSTILAIALRLGVYDSHVNLLTYTPVLNMRVLAFVGSFALLATFLHSLQQEKDKLATEEREMVLPIFFVGNSLMLLWVLSYEVVDYYNQKALMLNLASNYYDNLKNVSLSISWLLYAVISLAVGITWKRQVLRLCALGLFGLVVLKVFLYDTVSLNNLYRFVSYITLGIILLFTGYLYNRFRERIIQFIKASD